MRVGLERISLIALSFGLFSSPVSIAQYSYGELVGFESVQDELGIDSESLYTFDGLAYAHCDSLRASQTDSESPPMGRLEEPYAQCFKNLDERYRHAQDQLNGVPNDTDSLDYDANSLLELDGTDFPSLKENTEQTFLDLGDIGHNLEYDENDILDVAATVAKTNVLDMGEDTEITVARLENDFLSAFQDADQQYAQQQIDRELREAEQLRRARLAQIEDQRRLAEQRRMAEEAARQRQVSEQREPGLLTGFLKGFAGAVIDRELEGAGYAGPSFQRMVMEDHFDAELPESAAYVEQKRRVESNFQSSSDCNAILTEVMNSLPDVRSNGVCETAKASFEMNRALANGYSRCGAEFTSEANQYRKAANQSRETVAAACVVAQRSTDYPPSSNTGPGSNNSTPSTDTFCDKVGNAC